MKVLFLITAFAAAVLVGCGSTDAPSTTAPPNPRCLPVSETVLESIEKGFVMRGIFLRDGWAVESEDYEDVYFMSVLVDGGTNRAEVGTWVTDSVTEVGDYMFAVDQYARLIYSDWDFGSDSTMRDQFSETDDGYSVSRECASE